jgi:large subunit ribosomal protein L32e
MVVKASSHKRIVKKRIAKVHRFHSDRYGRLSQSWRKSRGIDNKMRRRISGTIRMPVIGYGSDKKTRYLLPCGMKKFLIRNLSDLEILLMNNRKYAGEIAHSISAQTRLTIIQRAKELNVRLLNDDARVKKEEHN